MDWLQNILPTVLVVSTGLITWFLKDNSEKLKIQREKLVEEKRNNYVKILEPIIRTLTGAKDKIELAKAIKHIKSFEYKKTAFHLMLFGSDSVVKAYNNYFQYIYKSDDMDPKIMLEKLGEILLEIRKDLGNSKTKLDELDMLSFMINDIEQIRNS